MITIEDKSFIYRIVLVVITISTLFASFVNGVHAEIDSIEDGTYFVDYEILRGDNDSVSIANDYFDKPATLIVEGEEQYIQFWINHSQWVQELQAPLVDEFVDVDIVDVNEADDLRLVQFKVDQNLEDPIELKMHVYIDSMDPVYDHRYTVRFDVDLDTIKQTDSVEIFRANGEEFEIAEEETSATENELEDPAETNDASVQETTSNSTLIIAFVSIAVIVLGAILFYVMRKKK